MALLPLMCPIAAVGVGGRGLENLSNLVSENIVALCDVDSRQGAPAFKRFDKAARYVDFRWRLGQGSHSQWPHRWI